jgi:hypothetical protein
MSCDLEVPVPIYKPELYCNSKCKKLQQNHKMAEMSEQSPHLDI